LFALRSGCWKAMFTASHWINSACLSVCRAYSTICGKINKSLQNCPQGGLTSVGDEAGRSCRWCTCVMCLIAATELLLSVDLCLCTNCVTVTGGVLQLQWRTSCFVIRIKCLCLSGWWNPVGQMGGACCCYVREKCIHCAGWTVCVPLGRFRWQDNIKFGFR
jgi:hypothetical protein